MAEIMSGVAVVAMAVVSATVVAMAVVSVAVVAVATATARALQAWAFATAAGKVMPASAMVAATGMPIFGTCAKVIVTIPARLTAVPIVQTVRSIVRGRMHRTR